jgi:predicted dienelactone hydrolase
LAAWLGLIALSLAGPAQAQVGLIQFRAGDLPITMVYPTDARAIAQEYGPFRIDVAPDAAPIRGNGRLIVISHGTGGDAFTLHTLARTLAIAGFVVAQPEHQGDNWRDQSDSGIVSWQRRPGEIRETIDAVAASPRFAALLALDRVGVYGMSAGGGTGLVLAGANWSLASLRRHCSTHAGDDAGFCLYGLRTQADRDARIRSYSVPTSEADERLLAGPAEQDRRIAAVAVSVPVGAIFTRQSLVAIHIPVGIVEARADQVLKPIFHSTQVLENCPSCLLLDSVVGGGHFDTLSPWPDSIARAAAAMPGASRNPAIDDARRQQSYDRIAAFFVDKL